MRVSGTKLATARHNANVSRSELAEVAGVSFQRIWQIELDNGNMNDVLVRAIAKKLHVDIKDITEDYSETTETGQV